MLSIYSRHYPPCPSDDINYKRCRCPKWINDVLGSDGPFIRRSAKTRSWEKAEDFKPKLEEELQVHPWLFIWLRRVAQRRDAGHSPFGGRPRRERAYHTL